MDVGNVLLIGTALLSVLAAFLAALVIFYRFEGRQRFISRVISVLGIAAFALLSVALLMLIWMALDSDFTYRYVWANSSTSMEPIYKASSIWAGGEGALLLCAWFIGLVLVIEDFLAKRHAATSPRYRSVFVAAMSTLLFVFSLMVLTMGLFDRITLTELLYAPNGQGMDYLLMTPEMVVHAPLIFGAYACLAALFAASLAHVVTGEKNWSDAGLLWGRLGWLLLTIGIAIGAVWAYYVIGWGGYWSWDPVETSSLLPWFMATAFLHTQMRRSSGAEYRLLSPLFGMLSLVGVVFVSFIVRAGGLWRFSVHDYGTSSASSAVSRLIALLGQDASVAGTFGFLLVLLFVSVAAVVWAWRRTPRAEQPPEFSKISEYVNDRDNMLLTVALISITALVALILLLKNMNSDPADVYAEFNQKMSILFVALMVSMGICLIWRMVGNEKALWVAVGVVVMSFALAVASASFSWSEPLVMFSLPSYLVATAASATKLATVVRRRKVLNRLYGAGAHVVHLGVALLLVAFVISANLQSYPAEGYEVALPVSEQVELEDYTLSLVSIEVSDEASDYPAEVAQVRTAHIELSKDGKVIEEDVSLKILYGYNAVTGYYLLETVPYVRSSVMGDLYLSFTWMSDYAVLIHAKVVPLMGLLWIGATLLCVGLTVRLIAWRPQP